MPHLLAEVSESVPEQSHLRPLDFNRCGVDFLDRKERAMFSKEVVFSPHLLFSVAVVLLCLTCATTQGDPPFECFAVSDLVRIFEDGYNCPEPQSRKSAWGHLPAGRLAAEAWRYLA